jgi:hypothetical protein
LPRAAAGPGLKKYPAVMPCVTVPLNFHRNKWGLSVTFDFQSRPVGGHRTFGPATCLIYGSRTLFRITSMGRVKPSKNSRFSKIAWLGPRLQPSRHSMSLRRLFSSQMSRRTALEFVIAPARTGLAVKQASGPGPAVPASASQLPMNRIAAFRRQKRGKPCWRAKYHVRLASSRFCRINAAFQRRTGSWSQCALSGS